MEEGRSRNKFGMTPTISEFMKPEDKEILNQQSKEKYPIYEIGQPPEIKKPVESWLEKLEKGEDITLPQPVTDDQGQIILDDAAPQHPKIVLPLTETEIEEGSRHKIWESVRWLSEWCVRMEKMYHGRVVYASA